VAAHFSHLEGSVARAPAAYKVAATLVLILGVGALPAQHALWGLGALPVLLAVALVARLSVRAVLRRLLFALPFLLGVAFLALFQRHGAAACLALLVKTTVSLLAVQLLAQTTPISDLLRALRRARVPEVLCTTIALLHRYLFLLVDESARMRRARAGRTLRTGRFGVWRAHGNSLGLLFVRTVSRAERVQAAMRSRGAP
jgi:cobalt/nickel transport system permease protein